MFRLPFMLQALLASLLLSTTLAYFGIHVVLRRIVFVDLALAQISAVGVAAALLLGQDPTVLSLVFTLTGAALLSIRTKEERIPQEAIMGIVYAVASAVAILLVAKTPHGEADVLKILFGNILAVTTEQIIQMAIVFGLVGILHVILFSRFLQISLNPEEFYRQRSNASWWNFLFYLSLGLVIALAIRSGGVLLCFSWLIIPAVTSMLFSRQCGTMLAIAWALGAASSILGLYFSFLLDLPTGSATICTLGLALLLAGAGKALFKRIL
ncbi:MAG: hypothetical protein A3G93_10565 [Nitrospinae bacterium RIFCSPLOWO2_12_FULL_45_22]|nr:MAG: hypothetical protein A3G93_10565 [Nitrospinae bacterium RIFCSPLOWO2_12_FULL_45_22]